MGRFHFLFVLHFETVGSIVVHFFRDRFPGIFNFNNSLLSNLVLSSDDLDDNDGDYHHKDDRHRDGDTQNQRQVNSTTGC